MGSNREIVVVGAGLAGLASAWALQRSGWAVTVIDRCAGVAEETSFANAGMLTPSMAEPWNSPGIAWKLMCWLGREDSPMLLRPAALPQYLRWGLRFLWHSAPARHRRATQANWSLALASLREFQALRRHWTPDYDLGTRGTLQVYRDAGALAEAEAHARALAPQGLTANILDRDGVCAIEPLLAPVAGELAGGVHYPDDETGDAYRYCQGLHGHLERAGVCFEFDTAVRRLRVERGRLQGLETADGALDCDRAVLAAGAWSPSLLARAGLYLPIRPVKGYSLTVPCPDAALRPSLSVIDQHLHAAITPYSGRLRLAGTAEFSGFDRCLRPGRIEALWTLLKRLLPGTWEAVDRAAAEPWCGFRPMAADGVPYIGESPIAGLYLNTGHGHLGWTQSLGSGALLAALLEGQPTAIDPQPFRWDRS